MDSISPDVSQSAPQSTLIRQLDKIAAFLESKPRVAIAVVSLLYLAGSLVVSATKLMWFDELHSYHVAQLPTTTDVIRFYAAGLDIHTPVCALIERGSIGLLGNNFLGLRVPHILGYLLFCLCVYRFVCIRAGPLWGLAAMTFPLVCSGLYYATDIRPYGLVLGLSAMAAVCWQEAGQAKNRLAVCALLWFFLAACVSLHYYAVFVAIPFGIAELARWRQFRRADWAVAMAIATSPLIIALFVPAIQKSRMIYAANYWAVPKWLALKTSYEFLLAQAYGPIAAVVFLCLLIAVRTRDSVAKESAALAVMPPAVMPPSERTLSGALALLPVVVVPASFVTGAFSERYVLPALIGVTLYLILLAWRACGGNKLTALVATSVFLGWFVMHTMATVRQNMAETGGYPFVTPQPFAARRWLPLIATGELPIVVAPATFFLQFQYYAPVDLEWRIYYLANPPYAMRLDRTDSSDSILINLAKAVPRIYVSSYDEFIVHQKKFLLLADVTGQAWILHKLRLDGAHLELLMRHGRQLLFEVTFL
jgi:hypothetical protein